MDDEELVDYSSEHLEDGIFWQGIGGSGSFVEVVLPLFGVEDLRLSSNIPYIHEGGFSSADLLLPSSPFSQTLEGFAVPSGDLSGGFGFDIPGGVDLIALDPFLPNDVLVHEGELGGWIDLVLGHCGSRSVENVAVGVQGTILGSCADPLFATSPKLNSGFGSDIEVDERARKNSGPKRRKSFVKTFRSEYNYALSEDVGWDRIMQMANCSLVRKVIGRQFPLKTIVKWVTDCWKEALVEVSMVVRLTRGWWVKLMGLPMHYWSKEHFWSIRNILGTFFEEDLSLKETNLLRVACILVNINIRQGLVEDMMLTWGRFQIKH